MIFTTRKNLVFDLVPDGSALFAAIPLVAESKVSVDVFIHFVYIQKNPAQELTRVFFGFF